MKERARTRGYQKDHQEEELLAQLNTLLAPLEQVLKAKVEEPSLPVVFIIGPPRSGTTLVSQLLAHWGGLGYIDNFVARFWMAPGVGARIERALKVREWVAKVSYLSEYGVTQGWVEPHEFGYFWNQWFDLGQEVHKLTDFELQGVDAQRLRRSVAAIEAEYQRPMVFKNNTWCTFQAGFLARVFPRSVFVVCERNPLFVAQSILIARKERLGHEGLWWSVRPKEYPSLKDLPWWDQIAGQVLHTIEDLEAMLAQLPGERVVRAKYERLCENPKEVAQQIAIAVNRLGGHVQLDGEAPEKFVFSDSRRVNDQDWARLTEACKQLLSVKPRISGYE